MFRAERMVRVLMVIPRTRSLAVIEALHDMSTMHIRDHREGRDALSLCPPLEGASEASETLIRLRSIISALGLRGHRVPSKVDASEVIVELEAKLDGVEKEVNSLVEERGRLEGEVRNIEARLEALGPFISLDLELGLLRPYDSLWTAVGPVESDPGRALEDAGIPHELFRAKSRMHANFMAVFVEVARAEEASSLLAECGLSTVAVPEGEGHPADVEKRLHASMKDLRKAADDVRDSLGRVKKESASMLVAAEEHLSIEVEKLESPLRFGGTTNATFIEGWVPSSRMDGLELSLTRTVGDAYHLEVLDDGRVVPGGHGHGHGKAGKAEVANDGGEAVEEPEGEDDDSAPAHAEEDDDEVEPPVLLRNPGWALPYEMLVNEVSTPSYKELDPSVFMFVTFPLFFGMMMGDIAYGLLTAVGAFVVGRKVRNLAVKKVASMLYVSGVVSIIFGIIYGEFLGFELYGQHGILYHHDLYLPSLGLYLPINRFEEAMFLIKVCLYLGIVHLTFGLIIGFYNERITHGALHAFLAKGSWVMILFGGTIAVNIALAGTVDWGDPFFLFGMGLLVGGIVALVAGEGPIALLHVPSILSNVLSYIRIFALGLAAVGIAMTFNQIAAPIWEQGGVMLVLAIVVGFMGHLLNLFLGILGPVMHSLRLHYVEWMTKFYTGGGVAYKPFGRQRTYTKV